MAPRVSPKVGVAIKDQTSGLHAKKSLSHFLHVRTKTPLKSMVNLGQTNCFNDRPLMLVGDTKHGASSPHLKSMRLRLLQQSQLSTIRQVQKYKQLPSCKYSHGPSNSISVYSSNKPAIC